MKISQIICQILRVKQVVAKTASCQDVVLLRVRTGDGLEGVGEADASPEVIKAIVDAGSGIWKALKDLASMVLHVFVDAGKWLWQAGKDIVNGLINGLKSMGSSLVQTVTTLGGLIPKWKGPPEKDKVMLVQNGQLIMQGLITGIDSQTDALRKKLEQVTTTVTASVNPTLNLGAPSAASALSRAGGNTYVNHVDLRGSQVMSDADMDKFVTKIGNRIATRFLPASGTFIRM